MTAMQTEARYIFAGCGAMGLPMALALHEAQYAVRLFDVKPLGDDAPAAIVAASLNDLHAQDTLFIVVRNHRQILDVCFDQQAVFTKDDYPRVVVICSTISPHHILDLKKRLPDDVSVIDAPMSGAPIAARLRTLTFMIGGDEAVVETLMPVFKLMGNNIYRIGPGGHGMATKVLNNYIAACSVISVRTALHHAAKLGLQQQTLLDVIASSSGQNWFASNRDRIDWSDENYAADNTIGILEKDVNAALDAMLADSGEDGTDSPVHCDRIPGVEFGQAMLTALRQLPATGNKHNDGE